MIWNTEEKNDKGGSDNQPFFYFTFCLQAEKEGLFYRYNQISVYIQQQYTQR